MKIKQILLLPLLAASLIACNNADEWTSSTPKNVLLAPSPEALEADATLFPTPDKSYEFKIASPLPGFNKLVEQLDPKVGLNREQLDVNDQQLEEIKQFTDKLLAGEESESKKLETLIAWVNKTVKYKEADNDSYSVFQNKTAVCQGYSNLLRTMLYTQNIPSIPANGMLRGVGGHAWVYAYVDQHWRVADPTNQSKTWKMSAIGSYTHLMPQMTTVDFFEDDNFVYNYNESLLNIKEVKKGDATLVVPFSINGFRVGSFNPTKPLPDNIRHIYLGSNIQSVGEGLIGLKEHRSQDEAIFVDPKNPYLGSEYGVLYRRNYQKELSEILYVPSQMTSLKLRPMEKVEKNTLYNLPNIEEIVILPGTKQLEAYAIEDCPNLKHLYLPKDCKLDPQALYKCPADVQIHRGDFTGIVRVKR